MPTEEPPLVVLDTNVILDCQLFQDPAAQGLTALCTSGQLRWITTAAMRAELEHVLGRPTLEAWWHRAEKVLAFFDRCSELLPTLQPGAAKRLHCTDPDDQMFIDLALAHSSKWLLTRDKALLRLARKAAARGTVICRPIDWPPGGP